MRLTKGQTWVLALAAAPMAAVGIAGGIATYANMDRVLGNGAAALGMVAAGEGAVLIASLVALAVTLMGQHTPVVVRLAMWLLPVAASAAGIALAPHHADMVVMGFTPLAMTAAGEGVAFVARRVVAYRTGVDLEQQRRSGLLLWHANRAANGKGFAKWRSERAVWRLTKSFSATDGQLSVQLGEVQRYRISEGADANLAAVLSGSSQRPSAALPAPETPKALEATPEAVSAPAEPREEATEDDDPNLDRWMADLMDGYRERHPELVDDAESDPTAGLMSSDDVAVDRNVKPGTVRTWIHRGKLVVAHRDAHGKAWFRPADVAKLP